MKINKIPMCLFLLTMTAVATSVSAFQKDILTCDITAGRPLLNHGGEAFGPYNYRVTTDLDKVTTVLNNHFTKKVERLESGQSVSAVEVDLDFTLRGVPNYPRALAAMAKFYTRKFKSGDITDFEHFARQHNLYTPECYFKRAIYFDSHSPSVHYLFAIFLHQMENHEAAEKLYLEAKQKSPKNIEISYNLGLLYVEMEKFDEAKKYAIEAYEANFPLPGLKNKLAKAGVKLPAIAIKN